MDWHSFRSKNLKCLGSEDVERFMPEYCSWEADKGKHFLLSDSRKLMPAPRRFLVASTSMPLAVGWGWNVCIYLGLLTLLLLLMGLLLWVVLKQLGNSVGNGAMQSRRSFREPPFGNCRSYRFWEWKHSGKLRIFNVTRSQSSGEDYFKKLLWVERRSGMRTLWTPSKEDGTLKYIIWRLSNG